MAVTDVLLKTQQVATAFGVGVSTVKRWVDAGRLRAVRTVGGHRLIPDDEALRFAHSMGLHHVSLASLNGSADGGELKSVGGEAVDGLTSALRRGRSREARDLIVA